MRVGSTALAVVVLVWVSQASAAVVSGQIDTFEDGTTQNWTNGEGFGPSNALGGPAGASDHFFKVTSSGGFGSGSKLVSLNRTQWTGSYSGVISKITMDLKDFGSGPLSMRMAFKTDTFSTPPGWVTPAITVPADGAWHHVTFNLSGLIPMFGASGALTNIKEVRLLDASSPSFEGDVVASGYGADNILAVGVPEPASATIFASAVGGLFLRRRRK